MNDEKKKIHFICSPEVNKGTHRKITSLDWKKIASIDIEKVIQTCNVEFLEDLLSQIAYCKPEDEFDSQSVDSGFLKVFKLSQVIIEHLVHTQEILESKCEHALAKYKEVEEVKIGQTKEIQSLKETLSTARRELKRRKELLASVQSEVIGENKDEFDPCPYCSKRFLTSAYLLSHMQRRHQGLPLHPVFPAQSIFQSYPPKFINNDYQPPQKQLTFQSQYSNPVETQLQKSTTHSDHQGTQTEKTELEQSTNIETISAIVEHCLKEKAIIVGRGNDSNQNQLNQPSANINDGTINCSSQKEATSVVIVNESSKSQDDENTRVNPSIFHSETEADNGSGSSESVKEIMAKIKLQLDLQWKYLSGKIDEAGLEELKSLAVNESGELQGIECIPTSKSNQNPVPSLSSNYSVNADVDIKKLIEAGVGTDDSMETEIIQTSTPTPTAFLMNENVEERFQKQQHDLATLKKELQYKMQEDMIAIESKLESQERYWRSKLRLVEDEYSLQFKTLRDEFQTSLHKTLANQAQIQIKGFSTSHSGKFPSEKSHNNDDGDGGPQSDDAFTVVSESPGLVVYKPLQDQEERIIINEEQSEAEASPLSYLQYNSGQDQFQQRRAMPRISVNRNQIQLQSIMSTNANIQRRSITPTPTTQEDEDALKVIPGSESVRIETGRLEEMPSSNANAILIPQPITKVQTKVKLMNPASPALSIGNTCPVAKPRNITSGRLNPTQHDKQNTNNSNAIVIVHQHGNSEPDENLSLDQVEEYSHSIVAASENDYDDDISSIHGSTKNYELQNLRETTGKNMISNNIMPEEGALKDRMNKMKEKVSADINNQLEALGLPPDGAEIGIEAMQKTMKKLHSRRESAIEEASNSEDIRETVGSDAKITLLSRNIHERLGSSSLATPEKTGKSPLNKMISAVKMSGKKMHKKVKSAISKKPKQKQSPTLIVSNKVSSPKGSFFSRSRWGRKKKDQEKGEKGLPLNLDQEKIKDESESGDTESESESADSLESSEPDVEVHYITKTKNLQSTSAKAKTLDAKTKSVENGEESCSSYETEEESNTHSKNTPQLTKKKLTVKDNKASKLRYREARKNSKAAAELSMRENKDMLVLQKTPPSGRKLLENPFLVSSARENVRNKDNSKEAYGDVGKTVAATGKGVSKGMDAKKPVRRSLQAEFDHVTPKKGITSTRNTPALPGTQMQVVTSGSGDNSESDSDDKTDIDSSSSWDDMLGNKQDGSEMYTNSKLKETKQSFLPEISDVVPETRRKVEDVPDNSVAMGSPQIIMAAPKHGVSQISGGRPQTARTRIVMDSWDTDDDDVHSNRANFNAESQRQMIQMTKKTSLVSQQWNSQPHYPSTNEKRTPMNVINEPLNDKHRRTSKTVHAGRNHDPTDDPLNNSWDSN